MADMIVRFLGEEYSFPEELKEYVVYCNEFEKINSRLSQELLAIMKKKILADDENEQTAVGDIEQTLKDKMRNEGKQVISMLAKYNIFDITESDVVDSNKGFIYYDEVYKNMMQGLQKNLADKLQRILDGWDDAQDVAYSQITGTGISMYSNSIIAHMTLAAFETSTIKKQCQQADKVYENAMNALERNSNSEFERKNAEVMIKIYPEIAKALGMFVSDLMEIFLNKLQVNNIYDYSKAKPFNMKRSSELLNNISLVDDKKGVLVQAFRNCPYNPDVYAKALELGFVDFDTFKTAKEFYQDSILLNVVEDYCKKNLKSDKIADVISILAYYKDVETRDIWRSMYSKEINGIESKYIDLHTALKDNVYLCRWIKDNITNSTDALLKKPNDEIMNNITKNIDNIVSESEYQKYSSVDLISPDILRLDDSQSTDRSGINAEIVSKLMERIKEYIIEAIKRRDVYLDAQKKYDDGIRKINDEISVTKQELSELGLFAFSKKKEMNAVIADKESELERFKKDNAPDKLFNAFEKMYI